MSASELIKQAERYEDQAFTLSGLLPETPRENKTPGLKKDIPLDMVEEGIIPREEHVIPRYERSPGPMTPGRPIKDRPQA